MALLPLVLALTFSGPGVAPATPPTTPDTASVSSKTDPPPSSRVESFDDDPLDVRRAVLDNGLTVFLTENHERPEVFGAVVVRTGAKNDPADNTGMAHYLEHMLFKGTTRLGTTNWDAERPLQERLEALYEELRTAKPARAKALRAEISDTVKQTYAYAVPNEFDQLLEQLGGTGINAFTSYDETVYHNTFPASQIAPWLELYAHRFESPVFRLFPTELEAVYEEKNIAIDTVGYQLFRSFMHAAFPGHPYGASDVLGEVEHLKKPSLRAMREYYDRYYVPGNMALVLSGDFDTAETLPLIESTFGRWKARKAEPAQQRTVAPFELDQRHKVRLSPVRVGAVAFHTVPESHPDFAALQVARRLLTNEQRSGFIDRLAEEGKVLLAVHVPADFTDQNLDVVAYAPRLLTQSFRSAEKAVLRQFERLRKGEFDEKLFGAVKDGLLAEEQASWEDNRDRALTVGHAFVTKTGYQGYLQYLDRLEKLTRQDLMTASGQFFGDRRLLVRSRMGFPKKKRLKKPKNPPVKPKRGAHSDYFRDIQKMPTADPKLDLVDFGGDIKTLRLRPGMTLEASTNPFNDLYQLELHFGAGDDLIDELALLADYLPRIGSEQTPTKEFRQRLFELNTTLSAQSDPDRFVVRLEGPQRHMDGALALLSELMRSPQADRKPLRQLRREIWGYRRIDRKDPAFAGRALRDYVLYGDKSAFVREYGPRSARRVGPDRLVEAWEEVQRREVEIRYVGREPIGKVGNAVARHIPSPPHPVAAVPHIVYPRVLPSEPTVFFLPRRDAVQTQLWFAVEGAPVPKSDVPAAMAFSEYIGGSMAGLVFQEIREFRALAYSASARYRRDESAVQKGYLVGYVGCQADKTFEALDVMMGIITDMPEKRDRLGLVRKALARSQETSSPSFRELQEEIESWQLKGYTGDPRRWLVPAFGELEFDDILAFYSNHVEGRPVAIMVVGDPRKVDRKKLEKYGKVVRVRPGKTMSP